MSDRIAIIKLHKTGKFLNVPSFILKKEWPSSLPNLNPLDYSIWSILMKKVLVKLP